MGDHSESFEVEDRSRSGDRMAGSGTECIDFIMLCRDISRDRAIHIVTLAWMYGSLELPEFEIFVRRC